MRNPKTVAGLIGLGVMLLVLGFLIGRIVPAADRVMWERSLTPSPEPPWPDSVMAVTPDPALPTPEPVVRSGMTGQAVKDIQSRLYTLGYYTAAIDGQYGPGTKEAVTAFQRLNGLDTDGIVGAETRQVLFSAGAKPWRAEETQGPEETAP